ncbi:Por secretion system C-terminal sorting domain-containing protein, partial [Mesonia phycicola]
GVRVYLKDNYLNTSVEITNQASSVSFQVDDAIAESIASNRFEIMFEEETLSSGSIDATNIAVYPNPLTGNELSIQLSSAITGEVSIQLFDILGKNVFTATQDANTSTITLENLNLNSGVYLLKLSTENGQSYVKKIVKN